MAQPLGDDRESPRSAAQQPGGTVLAAAKKKGCKRKKCSNWKGGKCRCGRD